MIGKAIMVLPANLVLNNSTLECMSSDSEKLGSLNNTPSSM